jgi:hypothetical protein
LDRDRVTDLSVTDVRPFVPALDLDTSRSFYLALGWSEPWRVTHVWDPSGVLLHFAQFPPASDRASA